MKSKLFKIYWKNSDNLIIHPKDIEVALSSFFGYNRGIKVEEINKPPQAKQNGG